MKYPFIVGSQRYRVSLSSTELENRKHLNFLDHSRSNEHGCGVTSPNGRLNRVRNIVTSPQHTTSAYRDINIQRKRTKYNTHETFDLYTPILNKDSIRKNVYVNRRRLVRTSNPSPLPRNPSNNSQYPIPYTKTLTQKQTETLFSTYSQYSTSTTLPPQPSTEELRLESQIQTLLQRRETLIAQLTRLLDSESALTSSALKQSNLSRHREILTQHTHELSRLSNSITSHRQKTHLLTSIHSDISSFHASNPGAEEAEYMLDERTRIDRSNGIADTVLAQAYAVNESFGTQREILASVNRRIVGAASQVPGINGLIGRISGKKRRDGIILAVFIAVCFLVVFWFR